MSVPTARRRRQRFAERRLDGLADEPRRGQPRKITDAKVKEVIIKTLEEAPPDGVVHWSTRKMAAAVGLNRDLPDLAPGAACSRTVWSSGSSPGTAVR